MHSALPRGAKTQNAPLHPPNANFKQTVLTVRICVAALGGVSLLQCTLCLICNFLPFAIFCNTTGTGAKCWKFRLCPLACDAYWELLAL